MVATEAGLSQEQFWAYTPRELDVALRAMVARRERQEELAIFSGWVAAYCTRAKRFPRLASLVRGKRQRPPQSPEEQYATAKMITAALGGAGTPSPERT
jgi:hypothetical protein